MLARAARYSEFRSKHLQLDIVARWGRPMRRLLWKNQDLGRAQEHRNERPRGASASKTCTSFPVNDRRVVSPFENACLRTTSIGAVAHHRRVDVDYDGGEDGYRIDSRWRAASMALRSPETGRVSRPVRAKDFFCHFVQVTHPVTSVVMM
jgi:hypothetical protein